MFNLISNLYLNSKNIEVALIYKDVAFNLKLIINSTKHSEIKDSV